MKCTVAVKCDEARGSVTVQQSASRSSDPPKVFTFDRVFGPESKQTDVYNDAARAIVEGVLEGYNGEIYLVQSVMIWLQNYVTVFHQHF